MKFYGIVGFLEEESEKSPGIWRPTIVEKQYIGNVHRNTRRYDYGNDKQNPNLTVSNQISILSDLYARQNWASICYVIWNGVKWKVSSVDIEYARLVLTLGERYNENETGAS